MRRLAGTLAIVFFFTTFAAEGALIERTVELDLHDFSASGFSTTIDFDNVAMNPNGVDRLVLDILFVNGSLAVSSDPGVYPSFNLHFGGSGPLFGFCCTAPTLLGTAGNVLSDTLVLFEPGYFLIDSGDGGTGYLHNADFLYSGLRIEASFPGIPVSSMLDSLFFAHGFFNPIHAGNGSIAVVPEPGTFALFALGLAGLGLARRRKQQT